MTVLKTSYLSAADLKKFATGDLLIDDTGEPWAKRPGGVWEDTRGTQRQHIWVRRYGAPKHPQAAAASEAWSHAAQLLESEAAEEWRLDRGEGMPGGISKPGAQMIAQKLDQLARILRNRAREEQK